MRKKVGQKWTPNHKNVLTPCAFIVGKPPALGTDARRGLFAGDEACAPFGWPQEWSTKSVFISGFGIGFLQC